MQERTVFSDGMAETTISLAPASRAIRSPLVRENDGPMPAARNASLTWRNASCAISGRRCWHDHPDPNQPPFREGPMAISPASTECSRACRCASTVCSPYPSGSQGGELEVNALGTVDLGDARRLCADHSARPRSKYFEVRGPDTGEHFLSNAN
jgi:hypothetical protein